MLDNLFKAIGLWDEDSTNHKAIRGGVEVLLWAAIGFGLTQLGITIPVPGDTQVDEALTMLITSVVGAVRTAFVVFAQENLPKISNGETTNDNS